MPIIDNSIYQKGLGDWRLENPIVISDTLFISKDGKIGFGTFNDGGEFVSLQGGLTLGLPAGTTEGTVGYNSTTKKFVGRTDTAWVDLSGEAYIPEGGATGSRPATPVTYQVYFDTTIGKPVWYNGTAWVDATGTPA